MDWTEYFLQMARLAAGRSSCLHRKCGAILVRDRRVIATGYNGPASGLPHCQTCLRQIPGQDFENCRAVHAEENAILQLALHGGPSAAGATMYCTNQPCFHCSKLILQVRVAEVVYAEDYPDERGIELLRGRIKVTKVS